MKTKIQLVRLSLGAMECIILIPLALGLSLIPVHAQSDLRERSGIEGRTARAGSLSAEEQARRVKGKSYRYHGRQCKVVYEKLSWEEANARCKELGG